jgi:hypothetical protein
MSRSFVLTLIILLFSLFSLSSQSQYAEAAKKRSPHVLIQKQPAPQPLPLQPEAIPLLAVPPLLVLYDINRRVNCLNPPDPLGLGGPGFDGKPVDPAKGNVMIPCWQRRAMKP